MSLFGGFRESSASGSHGPLAGWWAEEFTPEEQTTIAEQFTKYPPLGTTFNLRQLSTSPRFLINAATWFTRSDMARIRIRLLEKSLMELGRNPSPAELHYAYMGLMEAWHKLRDIDSAALQTATDYCQRMIAIAPAAMEVLKRDGTWPEGTGLQHPGFNQLAVILDKQSRWPEAIEICRVAQRQGWAGDWTSQIDRYETKLAKSQATHRTSASLVSLCPCGIPDSGQVASVPTAE